MQNDPCVGTQSHFSASDLALIEVLLDRIIPPEKHFPGAGEMGVANYIDGEVGQSTNLKVIFTQGLEQVLLASGCSDVKSLMKLPAKKKDASLQLVESKCKDFFQELLRLTYTGYYKHPKIIALLGLEVSPPQPLGYQLKRGNLNLLENVRARGQRYREI